MNGFCVMNTIQGQYPLELKLEKDKEKGEG